MTKSSRPCAFCRKTEPLRNSHIIPEFMYEQNYTAKHHRSIGFRVRRDGSVDASLVQKGLREHLLCNECEGRFSKHFESPMKRPWNALSGGRRSSIREAIVQTTPEVALTRIEGLDYAVTKLLLLSIVWRGHESSLDEFRTVHLDSGDLKNIRSMLDARDAGAPKDYPITIVLIRPADHRGLFFPWQDPTGLGPMIRFIAGSVRPGIVVSRTPLSPLGSLNTLQEDGSILCISTPQRALPAIQRAAALTPRVRMPRSWLDEF